MVCVSEATVRRWRATSASSDASGDAPECDTDATPAAPEPEHLAVPLDADLPAGVAPVGALAGAEERGVRTASRNTLPAPCVGAATAVGADNRVPTDTTAAAAKAKCFISELPPGIQSNRADMHMVRGDEP